ncbi:MAG: hypothetical protein RIC14_13200 [Filomicrobium sp.]
MFISKFVRPELAVVSRAAGKYRYFGAGTDPSTLFETMKNPENKDRSE